MASLAPVPKAHVCTERKRLAEALLEAVRELVQLSNRETVNVTSGGDGIPGIDAALQIARERRDAAKVAYMEHIKAHGC